MLSSSLIDETGRRLPLIFTSFEGYQWFVPSYLVALSVKIFGLNEFAVRLPFAIFACLGLLAFVGLGRTFFPKNKWLVFWATVVLALSPGLILLSRTTSDMALFTHLSLLFLWLFFVLKRRKKDRLVILISSLLLLFVFLLLVDYLRLPGARQDLLDNHLGFFTDPTVINSVNQMRGENLSFGNPWLGKLFYNKTFYLVRLMKIFFDHLKPTFYFLVGDGLPRHGLSNFGPLLAVFLPLFLVGVWSLFRKKELSGIKWWLIACFLLSLLPSLFSLHSPDQEKLVLSLPVLAILIGYVGSRFKKYKLVLLVIFLVLNLGFVVEDALLKEPFRSQKDWQLGVEELVDKVQSKKDDFDIIFITDKHSPDIGTHFLFYLGLPSEELWQQTNLKQGKLSYRQWVSQIGKLKIGQANSWRIEPGEKGLVVITPEEETQLRIHFFDSFGRPTIEMCYQIEDQILDRNQEPIYLLAEVGNKNCLLDFQKEVE